MTTFDRRLLSPRLSAAADYIEGVCAGLGWPGRVDSVRIEPGAVAFGLYFAPGGYLHRAKLEDGVTQALGRRASTTLHAHEFTRHLQITVSEA
jgi:hypothetical protein